MLSKFSIGSFQFGPIVNSILSAIGLNSIKLKITGISIMWKPIGIALSGSLIFNDVPIDFVVVIAKVGKVAVAVDLTVSRCFSVSILF